MQLMHGWPHNWKWVSFASYVCHWCAYLLKLTTFWCLYNRALADVRSTGAIIKCQHYIRVVVIHFFLFAIWSLAFFSFDSIDFDSILENCTKTKHELFIILHVSHYILLLWPTNHIAYFIILIISVLQEYVYCCHSHLLIISSCAFLI